MNRLLITGAAGRIATALRPRLRDLARVMCLSDRVDIVAPGPNEEVAICDLADADAVYAAAEGCDGILHLGGCPHEDAWEAIRSANFDGTRNVYEAARRHRIGRVVFASSNHAMGFYPTGQRLDADTPPRPDSYYGLSKAFGEGLARLYWDKCGIESVCMRIGSCFEKPTNRRMLSTWLSDDDLAELVRRSFRAPSVGWTVVYGASANTHGWWDNSGSAHLGWQPRDNAETFRAEVEASNPPPDPEAPENRWQGAGFAAAPIIER